MDPVERLPRREAAAGRGIDTRFAAKDAATVAVGRSRIYTGNTGIRSDHMTTCGRRGDDQDPPAECRRAVGS